MKSSIIVLVLLFVVVPVFIGCSEKPAVNETTLFRDQEIPVAVTEAAFAYTGYARNGAVIVRGELTLFVRDSGIVGGRWQLRATGDTSRIGPQHGRGTLVGHLRNGLLNINLNPSFVDNNVLLMGRFNRERYVGEWSWVGFPGVLNSGTFQAVRRQPVVSSTE